MAWQGDLQASSSLPLFLPPSSSFSPFLSLPLLCSQKVYLESQYLSSHYLSIESLSIFLPAQIWARIQTVCFSLCCSSGFCPLFLFVLLGCDEFGHRSSVILVFVCVLCVVCAVRIRKKMILIKLNKKWKLDVEVWINFYASCVYMTWEFILNIFSIGSAHSSHLLCLVRYEIWSNFFLKNSYSKELLGTRNGWMNSHLL